MRHSQSCLHRRAPPSRTHRAARNSAATQCGRERRRPVVALCKANQAERSSAERKGELAWWNGLAVLAFPRVFGWEAHFFLW